jgi:hypothetical protein
VTIRTSLVTITAVAAGLVVVACGSNADAVAADDEPTSSDAITECERLIDETPFVNNWGEPLLYAGSTETAVDLYAREADGTWIVTGYVLLRDPGVAGNSDTAYDVACEVAHEEGVWRLTAPLFVEGFAPRHS